MKTKIKTLLTLFFITLVSLQITAQDPPLAVCLTVHAPPISNTQVGPGQKMCQSYRSGVWLDEGYTATCITQTGTSCTEYTCKSESSCRILNP